MAGPGPVKGAQQMPLTMKDAKAQVVKEEVGTGCASAEESMGHQLAGLRARIDALRKVCDGGRQAGDVTGTTRGGVLKYFADKVRGLVCATGTFQVTCGTEAAPSTPSKAKASASAATDPSDTSAVERELEEVALEAGKEMEGMKRGDASLTDVERRADKAFGR